MSARYFGGGGDGDVEQVSTLTPGQRGLLDQLTRLLRGQLGRGITPFPGERVAPASALQDAAFGLAGGIGDITSRLFGQAGLPLGQEQLGQAQEQLTRTLAPFDPATTISNFEPARQVALRTFERDILPSALEPFAGADAVDSAASRRAVTEAGTDLSLGLSAQLGTLLQQAEQAQLNRQQAGINQALQVAAAPSALTQAQGQIGAQGADLLSQLFNIGAGQRGIEQQFLTAEQQRFQEAQPFANPFLNLLPQALGVQAFENVVTPSSPGLGESLLPALGAFAGSPAGSSAITGALGGLGGLFGGGAATGAAGSGLATGALAPGGLGLASGAFLSDARVKENVKPITKALDKIEQLSGNTYNYTFNEPDNRNGGIMAQDLEKVLPNAVSEVNGVKMVRYDAVVGLLVEAIKELNEKIQEN
jgi:hypothetical protein